MKQVTITNEEEQLIVIALENMKREYAFIRGAAHDDTIKTTCDNRLAEIVSLVERLGRCPKEQ